MLDSLLFAKIVTSVCAVVALSLIAEHVSPRTAGILSGYPIGAAITLFFYGLEISPSFASRGAVYTPLGLIAVQSFLYSYVTISSILRRKTLPLAAIASVLVFLAVSWLMQLLSVGPITVSLGAAASIPVFLFLMHHIPDSTIEQAIAISHRVLLVRALIAAAIIVLIISLARTLGPQWAGVLSAFPSTILPLVIIVHATYGKHHAHTILKHAPRGLGAIIAYALTVHVTYPTIGIYAGTGAAFGSATVYLIVYSAAVRMAGRWGPHHS